ncbi:hypothetical protein [Aeoliella sp.]|uniref:hypothetical protein n=1 Tax=Aeoliella sp. TaxID=2795800 RepID=UPI003CCB8976
MTNRINADTDELRRQVINRRAPSRNGKPKPKSKGNRFASINWFIDTQMATLTSSERSAWFVLWRAERNGVASVSHQEIATKCGVSRRQAITAVNGLIDKELIRRIEKGNPQTSTANKYTLSAPT